MYSRLQEYNGTAVMDGFKFEINDIDSLYTENDSEKRPITLLSRLYNIFYNIIVIKIGN